MKGFTLIELILTIAILAILSGIAFNIYSNFQLNVKADEEINKIKSVLREAQAKAMSGENSASWGVRFFHPASGSQYYELFWGNSYAVGTTTESYFLQSGVDFVSPASEENLDVIFVKRTGGSASSSAITVSVKTSVSDITKSVSVTPKGLIE